VRSAPPPAASWAGSPGWRREFVDDAKFHELAGNPKALVVLVVLVVRDGKPEIIARNGTRWR